MSGYNEIAQWVSDNYEFDVGDNALSIYQLLNTTENWRSDLDDILLDEKDQFMRFLDDQIPKEREQLPELILDPLAWDFQPLDYLEYAFEPYVADFFNWVDSL